MKVGIQLYSVRNRMASDPVGTIREVVNRGYRNIEAANHNAENDSGVGFGVTSQDLKQMLDELGASIISAHVMPLNESNIDRVLEYHSFIGTKYIAVPIAFFRGRDDALRMAETLNRMGERCHSAGIQLLYHNHYHEFQRFDGEGILHTIATNSDPSLVQFEIDTYWTMRAGKDPIELLRMLGTRVRLIHQKDYTKGYEAEIDLLRSAQEAGDYIDMKRFERDLKNETFTEVGTGIMDIQSIIDIGNTICGAEYIILEQDYSLLDELESVSVSMDSFKQFSGIEW